MKVTPIKVELIDHMGTDLSVVDAARVSFDKQSEWEQVPKDPAIYGDNEGTWTELKASDAKLINYLAAPTIGHRLPTPVFSCELRHRCGSPARHTVSPATLCVFLCRSRSFERYQASNHC